VNEATRACIYRVLLAVQPVVLFYGIASEAEIAVWISAITAIFGFGLAAKNTSTKIDF